MSQGKSSQNNLAFAPEIPTFFGGLTKLEKKADDHDCEHTCDSRQEPRWGRFFDGGRGKVFDGCVVAHEQPDARPAGAKFHNDGRAARERRLRDADTLDVGPVRAAEVDEDPPRFEDPELGVTRAGIEVPMRIERDFAVRMAAEPNS